MPTSTSKRDRQHLLEAAEQLVAAFERVRGSRELWHIRGDLGHLRNQVTHMFDVVNREPLDGGLDIWQT